MKLLVIIIPRCGGTVVQQVHLLPYSSRVPALILSMGDSLCSVLHLFVWVSSGSCFVFPAPKCRWRSYCKLHLGVWMWVPYSRLTTIQGIFLPPSQCSGDRLPLTEDEWMKEYQDVINGIRISNLTCVEMLKIKMMKKKKKCDLLLRVLCWTCWAKNKSN